MLSYFGSGCGVGIRPLRHGHGGGRRSCGGRVGEYSYPQSVLQGSLDSMIELSRMLSGDAPTDDEKAARLQSAIDSFVDLGVIENKLAEVGKNDFTDAEKEGLNQQARSKY